MRVALGSDHAGFDHKNAIRTILDSLTVSYEDFGTASPAPVDYPDVAEAVALAVVSGRADVGILVCGTGIGMSIAANKIPGARAALAWDERSATLGRAHNNANILAIGGRTTPAGMLEPIVRAFLTTSYEGGRHDARLAKIAHLESRGC